jgi:hypothetical protein
MKRDPALISLSRDHHQALFVAQKLTRASPHTTREAITALQEYWRGHGQAHFRAEEEILFPAYVGHADPYDPLLARALCDHALIRQRIRALDPAAADLSVLSALGRLLQDHVRLEERKPFPQIEAALPPSKLAEVADALAQVTDEPA